MKIVSEEEKEEWIAEGEAEAKAVPCWKKAVNWMCGVEGMQDPREPVFTEEEAEELIDAKMREMSVEESPRGKLIVNIACFITLFLAVFLWAFFA